MVLHKTSPRLLLVLAVNLWAGAALADHPVSAAVVDLKFGGEITEGVREVLSRKLRNGLGATGMQVIPDERLKKALGAKAGHCVAAPCWRLAAGKLGCRFLAGGTVVGEDRTYELELYLADGYTGNIVARVQQRCDICGLQAVGEKMELAASALGAKVRAIIQSTPARVSVQTTPPGARILVDGDPVGTSPVQLELPAGSHQITVEVEGYLSATRTISAVANVEERVEIKLIRAAPRAMPRRVYGWTLVGAGVATLAVSAVLFAVDGGQTGCGGEDRVPLGQCPELRETTAGAWTTAVLGVGATAFGVYLLLRERRQPQAAALLF
jgi:hypothetical protein